VFEKVASSIVVVLSGDRQGSGVLVSRGIVVTNDHVLGPIDSSDSPPPVIVQAARRSPVLEVIARDPAHDICWLLVDPRIGRAATLASPSSIRIGEHVFAIGAPEGLELTISEGLVSSLRSWKDAFAIQTSAAISHGSSGGGLFDQQAHLVGITSYIWDEGESLNFAIPSQMATLRRMGDFYLLEHPVGTGAPPPQGASNQPLLE
jgi:S1-C subfamily serine protease